MASRPADPLARGSVLDGRYRIEELVGRGGYGRVYRATQIAVGREVAVKVVDPGDREAVARFGREADLMKVLEHPHTVRVFDVGTSNGIPFVAMELLRGVSLHEMIGRDGRIAPRTALEITAQILKALGEAHEKGFVHRDIKPENVFVTSHAGEPVFVKVLDFGIAKRRRGGDASLTVQGAAPGTPNYMAPEQILGHEPDARSDLYAVGLVLAEMLTGRTVFEVGGAQTLMQAHLARVPAPLDPIVDMLPGGSIVRRAVEKSPGARYQSATEMLAAVKAAASGIDHAQAAERRADAVDVAAPTVPLVVPAHARDVSALARPSAPSPAVASPVRKHPQTHPLQELPAYAQTPPPQRSPSHTAQPRGSNRGLVLVLAASVGILLALVAVLGIVVVLVRRDVPAPVERRKPPRQEEHAVVAPVPPPLDPRVRLARVRGVTERKQVLMARGWDVWSLEDRGLVLHRPPCHGSVTTIEIGNEDLARQQATLVAAQSNYVVLLSGTAIVSISMNREATGGAFDARCTADVVDVLAEP